MRILSSPVVDGVCICETTLTSGTSIQNCHPGGAGARPGRVSIQGSASSPPVAAASSVASCRSWSWLPLPLLPRLRNQCAPATYVCASPLCGFLTPVGVRRAALQPLAWGAVATTSAGSPQPAGQGHPRRPHDHRPEDPDGRQRRGLHRVRAAAHVRQPPGLRRPRRLQRVRRAPAHLRRADAALHAACSGSSASCSSCRSSCTSTPPSCCGAGPARPAPRRT